jgi:hypothetical protein
VKKIRQWIAEVRNQKHVEYEDLDRIVQRCIKRYRHLFPDYLCTKNGSGIVHHFNVTGAQPVSLEKPHGNREFVPRRYAYLALEGLEQIADFIESNSEEEADDDGDGGIREDHEQD